MKNQLKKLANKVFVSLDKNTENLMIAKQAIQSFPRVLETVLQSTKIKVSDLNLKELKEAEATYKKIYLDLFEIFKDETIDDAKGILQELSAKISQHEMVKDLDIKLKDLKIKGFNEEDKTKDKE